MSNLPSEVREIFEKIFGSHISYSASSRKQIENCTACDGTGWKSKEELVDYHRGDYEIIHSLCKECSGGGRVVRTYYSVSLWGKKGSSNFEVSDCVEFSKDPIDSRVKSLTSKQGNISYD